MAICKSQKFMRQSTCYLKSDIEKFFDTVDHDIMIYRVKRKVKDPKLLNLIEKLIRNTPSGQGLPIGNLTSQFFANVYLDGFDHAVILARVS